MNAEVLINDDFSMSAYPPDRVLINYFVMSV